MRWTALLVLPTALLLTACGTGVFRQTVVVKTVCLQPKEYDAKTQSRALVEYEALPSGSALRLFIGDYKQMRDQSRVCNDHNRTVGKD